MHDRWWSSVGEIIIDDTETWLCCSEAWDRSPDRRDKSPVRKDIDQMTSFTSIAWFLDGPMAARCDFLLLSERREWEQASLDHPRVKLQHHFITSTKSNCIGYIRIQMESVWVWTIYPGCQRNFFWWSPLRSRSQSHVALTLTKWLRHDKNPLAPSQGCHRSGNGLGKISSRSGKSQGILFWVRENRHFEII